MTTVEITCLIGQSNAGGNAPETQIFDSHQNAFSDAYVYNFNNNQLENLEYGINNQLSQTESTFGMELAWGEMAPQLSDNMQILIKQTKGGTSLYNEWNVDNNGSQYTAFRNQLDSAIAMLESEGYTVKINTVIHAAGENDAIDFSRAEEFEENMNDLINAVYNDYSEYMTDASWVITEMRSPHYQYTYGDEVLAIQQNIADGDSRVELVNTEEAGYMETTPTGIHYDSLALADIAREALQISYGLTQGELDALNLDDGSGVVLPEPRPMNEGTAGDDVLIGDWVVGYEGNDTILGSHDDNDLFGLEGDDFFNGLGGDDHIIGGFGNDYLYGSSGNDVIYGEEGEDRLLGSFGNDTMYGGKDNDIMNGDDGDDLMFGGSGNDYMNGSIDNDTLYGGSGDDNMHGGVGIDFLYGEDGNDYIKGEGGDDSLVGNQGVDSMYGGDGDDYINGGIDRDFIFGEEGNDNMHGDDGNDYMTGGGGNDYIKGDGGNDTLIGDAGRDNLYGGSGDDSLTGGTETDYFIFNTEDGTDTINDFEQGIDRIAFYHISDFADISFTDLGNDVQIQAEDVIINVLNNSIGDFDTSDFVFL